ncbi:hypothetical protein NGR_c16300 [Sinorhizobium fredii NGR234]|uniref:Uncharacterized protein n=1 Tax=Sinorhizobium fredii (strain NBRC 101917 / NGR234) TaxID=394 RepID=C3MD76_SINFN|nr:hypothetical protein NGR_c16300 [Sinorhizobium fredii NGR234]
MLHHQAEKFPARNALSTVVHRQPLNLPSMRAIDGSHCPILGRAFTQQAYSEQQAVRLDRKPKF